MLAETGGVGKARSGLSNRSLDLAPNAQGRSCTNQTAFEWGRLAYAPAQPGAPTRWSGPEVDKTGGQHGPNLGAVKPLHSQGERMGGIGSGFGLNGFLRRILCPEDGPERYLFLRDDGLVIQDTAIGGHRLEQAHRPLHHAILRASPAASQPVTGYDEREDSHFAVAHARMTRHRHHSLPRPVGGCRNSR